MKNYYEILEVNQKASSEVIEKAYKVLVKKYHPDLYNGEKREYAEQKSKEINEAYRILSDTFLMEQYDAELLRKKEEEQQSRYNKFTNINNYENKEQEEKEHKVGSFMGLVDLVQQIFKNRPNGKGIKNLKREDFVAAVLTIVITIIIGIILWFVPATNGFIRSLIPW